MINDDLSSVDESLSGELPSSTAQTSTAAREARQRTWIIVGVIAFILVLLAVSIGLAYYLSQPTTPTEQIRDVMIIFLALEFMILGVAMVILVIQLATLINLLQNEVKPLLESSNETVNTLRGTALFLSENLSEPVIRMNEYASGAKRFAELIGILRK